MEEIRFVQVGWFSHQHGEMKFISLLDSPDEPEDMAYRWKPCYVIAKGE